MSHNSHEPLEQALSHLTLGKTDVLDKQIKDCLLAMDPKVAEQMLGFRNMAQFTRYLIDNKIDFDHNTVMSASTFYNKRITAENTRKKLSANLGADKA